MKDLIILEKMADTFNDELLFVVVICAWIFILNEICLCRTFCVHNLKSTPPPPPPYAVNLFTFVTLVTD